jgi:cytochrome c oxidase cbb3-type subunit 3
MFSRFLASAFVLAALGSTAACRREERQSRSEATAEAARTDRALIDRNRHPYSGYQNNAYQLAQGQQLFASMNCVGCHSHGGGGMGPALMDDEWRYGGSMEQIVATIRNGRPNGMPAWRGKMTDEQMWQIAAFVRSLSGQSTKDVVPSRGDEMSNSEPLTITEREPVLPSSDAATDPQP